MCRTMRRGTPMVLFQMDLILCLSLSEYFNFLCYFYSRVSIISEKVSFFILGSQFHQGPRQPGIFVCFFLVVRVTVRFRDGDPTPRTIHSREPVASRHCCVIRHVCDCSTANCITKKHLRAFDVSCALDLVSSIYLLEAGLRQHRRYGYDQLLAVRCWQVQGMQLCWLWDA